MSLLRRVLPILAALVTALGAALVLLPTAARAQTETVRDRPHDVVRLRFSGSDCRLTPRGCQVHRSVDGRQRFADIVWSRSDYRAARLVLTMKVRGTTTAGSRPTYVGWDVAKPDGDLVGIQLLYDAGHVDLDIDSYTGLRCPAAAARVRPKAGLYLVTVPTRCLNQAPFVRVSASTLVEGDHASWHDVAGLGSDIALPGEVPEPHYGRRIHRG